MLEQSFEVIILYPEKGELRFQWSDFPRPQNW